MQTLHADYMISHNKLRYVIIFTASDHICIYGDFLWLRRKIWRLCGLNNINSAWWLTLAAWGL